MQRPETNMLNFDPSKPYTTSAEMAPVLLQQGWVLLDAQALSDVAGCTSQALGQWDASWNDLPCDPYLKDQGRYRRRRHASLVVDHDTAITAPHRAHWQPTQYNALHGGIHRLFAPMDAAMLESASFQQLVIGLGRVISGISDVPRWYVEAHQFRIDTTDGIGRPTPEGAHRDGVDFVAIIMIQRNGIKGGETRIFDAHGPHGIRLTLEQPWSALLLDDHAVIHETTPLQPLDEFGWRDTLVLTYRQGSFLEQR